MDGGVPAVAVPPVVRVLEVRRSGARHVQDPAAEQPHLPSGSATSQFGASGRQMAQFMNVGIVVNSDRPIVSIHPQLHYINSSWEKWFACDEWIFRAFLHRTCE